MLLAGASRVVITPPLQTPIGAFGEWTPREFTGITADIYARALVLKQDSGFGVALASVEATDMSESVSLRVRCEIERRTGVPASHVLLAMTHNHCGPRLNRAQRPYIQVAAEKIADAVVLANERLRPVRLAWSTRETEGPATNRRIRLKNGKVWPRFFLGPEIPTHETAAQFFSELSYAPNVDYRTVPSADQIIGSGPVNRQLTVMAVLDREDGTPVATLTHYGCHASVALESRNIHGDFPGFACRQVEETAGGVCLFVAGPSANVNCNAFLRERTDAEARRIALGFSDQILAALRAASVEDAKAELSTASTTAFLPLRPEMKPDSLQGQETAVPAGFEDQVKEAHRIRQEIQTLQKLEMDGVLPPVTRRGGIEIGIHAIRIGPSVLVSIPGELFVETGLRLCQASPWPRTLVVTHGNGSVGYIPERAAFGEGGYEDVPSYCSFVGPESEERILDASRSLLAAV